MKELVLKNGSFEAEPLVRAVMTSLSFLFESNPAAFFEIAMCARDRTHKPFGNTGDRLKELALLDDGLNMHNSIRNIILSAVSGEMLEMTLSSPVERECE